MFTLKNLPIVALVLFLFFACKRQSLLTYNDTPNTIYFADSLGIEFLDTGFFSFAYCPTSVVDSIYAINVYATGGPTTYDRVYSVVADPASSAVAGQEFQLPDSCIFHANHVKDTLYVRLLRAKVLQDSTFHLIVDLKPNKYFQTNMPFLYDQSGDTVSAVSFKIGVNDILTAGTYWSLIFQAYFGTFSIPKVELMNQIVGMPLDFWINWETNAYLTTDATYYAVSFSKYLNAEAAKGDTVYDTNGLPMLMGPAYQ